MNYKNLKLDIETIKKRKDENNAKILFNFTSNLIKNQKNLESEIVDMVNRNFKKFLLKI